MGWSLAFWDRAYGDQSLTTRSTCPAGLFRLPIELLLRVSTYGRFFSTLHNPGWSQGKLLGLGPVGDRRSVESVPKDCALRPLRLQKGDYDAHLPSSIFEGGREIGLAAADGEELIRPGVVLDPTEEQVPTLSLPGYVTFLQQDLMELGVNAVRDADGYFGPYTERAF